jgi:hypothetical protein
MTRRRARIAALGLAALAAAGCRGEGAQPRATRDLDVEAPLGAEVRIEVRTPNGSVTLRRAPERTTVLVRARLTLVGADPAEAEARAAAAEVRVASDGGVLRVEPAFPGGARGADGAGFVVEVPRGLAAAVETVNGRVVVERMEGPLRVTTQNGGVDVTDHRGAASVHARNGRVVAHGVSGDLDVTAENGAVTVEQAGGAVRVETVNGSLHVALAPEGVGPLRLVTQNGSAEVWVGDPFTGRVHLATTNGRVEVEDEAGRVTARALGTREGTVDVGTGGPPSSVRTTNGSVHFHVVR